MLRRDRPPGPDGPGAGTDRRQTRAGAGEGVPEGGHPQRGADLRDTATGTPQGGILSPLLANIALSVLDEHFTAAWAAMGDSSARHRRRAKGQATYRLVRYADDFVVLVHGTQAHAEALREQAAAVLAPMGLRLSAAKTRIVSVDQGFDFLGFRIQRQPKRGSGKPTVYTFPTKTALCSVKAKVRTVTQQGLNKPLAVLLHRLAPVLRGWTNYFRHGVSKATFDYLRRFTWRRVLLWMRRKHRRANWKELRRRYLPGWWPTDGNVALFDPGKVTVTRYRHRPNIPTPWSAARRGLTHRHDLVESRMLGNGHVRFGGRPGETDQPRGWHRAPGRPLPGAAEPGDPPAHRRRRHLPQPRRPDPPGRRRPGRGARRMAGLRPPLPLRGLHGPARPADHSAEEVAQPALIAS